MSKLNENRPTAIPQYNKAAIEGQGDRVPRRQWHTVNNNPDKLIRLVILEGWCIGFRSLSTSDLEFKHKAVVSALNRPKSKYNGRLGHNALESVADINNALHDYDTITDRFDAFIHIDAADIQYVYEWRLEQEAGLRKAEGAGMTNELVRNFVDGYYPAYELYTETLRRGIFRRGDEQEWMKSRGKQLRLIIGRDRLVREVIRIQSSYEH